MWFLIQRYFLDVLPADASEEDRAQRDERLLDLLERWEAILEGGWPDWRELWDCRLRGDRLNCTDDELSDVELRRR